MLWPSPFRTQYGVSMAELIQPCVQSVHESAQRFTPKRLARFDRLFKLLEHFVSRKVQAGSEHGDPHLQPSALPSFLFRLVILRFEPVQPIPDPINLLVDVLPDRPKLHGRRTAHTGARLRCSEETEGVIAGR